MNNETYEINGKEFPIIGYSKCPDGTYVPLVDIPMMSDERWQQIAMEEREKYPELYAKLDKDAPWKKKETSSMSELKAFNNEQFGEIRTIDRDGQPWFVAADVCRALEIANSRDAVSRLDDDEKGVVSTDTLGGMQEMSIVNEPGLYALVLGSRKPEARAFKRWITHEVIPAIRSTGGYSMKDLSPTDLLELQVKALRAIEQKQDEQQRAIAATNARLDAIGDTIMLNPQSWREECRKLIIRIAQTMGGNEYIREVTAEVYQLVDARAGVSLSTRLVNKRRRMADNGVGVSKRNKLTKADVIADDKKLIEIYIAIVKEMAIKYLDADVA